MKNNKGFTLVEVCVTVIIIGMLSVIGVAVYRKHIANAKYKEGMHLLQSIKEQMDLALSFAAEGEDPFAGYFTYGVVDTTFTFDRSAQNLGEFHIYPHNNKYFREFEIRVPDVSEKANFVTGDYGYVIEAYYPDKINKMLKIRLIGSSEGPYEVIKE